MINNNICPYCGSEMQLGYLGGVRYQLEWIPEGEKQRSTMLSNNTGIPLNKTSIFKLTKYMPIIVLSAKNLLFHKISLQNGNTFRRLRRFPNEVKPNKKYSFS
ncbi:MAG TPA: PF20097 family protein [Oscillospiraceae bacterium]|nr:PF20097 family protein [Oscillospiraceae bacterium]